MALFLAVSQHCHAEIYKWVDDQGTIHYTDTPPPNATGNMEINGTISSYTSSEVVPLSQKPGESPQQADPKKGRNEAVVMYSTAWCGVCKTAKNYFAKNNIRYIEYDVEKNKKGKDDFEKLNGRGVPIILVGNRRMNGFNQNGFERLYYE